MPKLFVISDVHGFYNEMKKALDDAGFDPSNENHHLISLGDTIDRGLYVLKVLEYLYNLPRKTLCFGNHEELFFKLCNRGYSYIHDISNGTADTVRQIGYGDEFAEMCRYALARTKPIFDTFVDYFETKNYIFLHSFLPLINKDGLSAYYTKDRDFEFDPDWRNASKQDWLDSRWGNPFALAAQGLNQTGKTIVFGHWATEHKWAEVEGRKEFDANAKFDIYYGDGIIGIDACTAYSKKCNVLVLEDEFLDQ